CIYIEYISLCTPVFLFPHLSVLQQPVLELVHPGNSVTLQCTFRHDSGESLPGIIHTHGDSSDQCKKSSKARSPTQSCVNELLVENLSLSDAGTYYCALAICGEIIFGNGTKLDIKGKLIHLTYYRVHLIKVCLLWKFGLYCFIISPFYIGNTGYKVRQASNCIFFKRTFSKLLILLLFFFLLKYQTCSFETYTFS
uniref:Ig-like domain-containing protein n=1 Tax=Electrophorus electricus TaxID=8005 RepID=A0A4W4E4P2_ELEEL